MIAAFSYCAVVEAAEGIVQIFSALLTPTIAIIATYIAYQQHQQNALKVRADLYDRRMKVFDATTDLLGYILSEAAVDFEQLRTFLRNTRQSYFLFGDEMPAYLTELYEAGVKMRFQNQKLNSNLPVGPERTALAEANGELTKWFSDQFELSQKKFAKYLRLI